MQLIVANKYGEVNTYNCKAVCCKGCGLRFICYTVRDKVELTWEQFYPVVKGKDKPTLVYRG